MVVFHVSTFILLLHLTGGYDYISLTAYTLSKQCLNRITKEIIKRTSQNTVRLQHQNAFFRFSSILLSIRCRVVTLSLFGMSRVLVNPFFGGGCASVSSLCIEPFGFILIPAYLFLNICNSENMGY